MQKLKSEWDNFTRNLYAPTIFLDMAFYFAIGAALERRVWLGPHLKPIFPNMFVVLCADPGVGKGLTIDTLTPILAHHKSKSGMSNEEAKLEQMIQKAVKEGASAETIALLRQSKEALEQIQAPKEEGSENKKTKTLFPLGPSSTTYEAIVRRHGKSVKVHHCGKPHLMAPSGIYTYHSMILSVEEASSLFKEKGELVLNYLTRAYNCADYEYETKNKGTDIITRSSLSLLAGTTPGFVKKAFSTSVFDEGFASRSIFTFALKNRFEFFEIDEFSQDQLNCRERFLARLLELNSLFGQAIKTEEARKFLKHYFEEIHPKRRGLVDPKLLHYMSRKNLHVQKLAMCIHYADSDSMEIGVESFESSVDLLDTKVEETMINCLMTKSVNPIADIQREILRFIALSAGKKRRLDEVLVKFFDIGNAAQINEALEFLITTKKIRQDGIEYVAI